MINISSVQYTYTYKETHNSKYLFFGLKKSDLNFNEIL